MRRFETYLYLDSLLILILSLIVTLSLIPT